MMTNDPSNNSPDFDPDATIEQSETEADTHPGGYSPSTPLPESIGKYRILREIGEGGMGTVYEAEQDSPRRKVALKVIKAGVVSKNLLLRFEIEAQILGKLDHPGIATIFEAGTFDEGQGQQPFFAMEFVQGQELLDYANSKKLGTRDRLALLAKIADAVQHAHQKGVIHRDLKPGNILVTNEGQIKILDFGVARATDADIQTATMQTDIGQLIGTIPYMSPEQASGNPDDLDTRSDVYALGIIGYELLTGQMPYDLKQKMIHEAVRVIREDEPKTLSAINKTFRGDVEIIVSKALVKEKDRRYQSASDLGSDIERYLNNEPIEARPPSTWYQLSKFSKRNKALVAGILAVLMVSVAGALISINFAMGEAEQKQLALDAAEEAKRADELQQVADFQSEQLGQIEIEMMGVQLRDSIIESAPEESRENLADSLARVNFTSIALGTLEANIFERTIKTIDLQFADQPLIQAQMLQSTADTLRELGLLQIALDPQERALAIRRKLLGDNHRSTLYSIGSMGSQLYNQGRFEEADPYIRDALEGNRRTLGDNHRDTLDLVDTIGMLLVSQNILDEGELYIRQALEANRRILGDEHPATLISMNNIGYTLRQQGRLVEAEMFYRLALKGSQRAFGENHPETLININNMSRLLWDQGKKEEAEAYQREALEGYRQAFGDDHPTTLKMMGNLGSVLYQQGKIDQAEAYFKEVLQLTIRVLGKDHPDSLNAMSNLGTVLSQQGRHNDSEPYRRMALEGTRRILGDKHPNTLTSISNMGVLLMYQGKLEEAEPYLREAVEGNRHVLGDTHSYTTTSIRTLVKFLDEQSRWSDSEKFRRMQVEIVRRAEPEAGAQLGSALVQLGINLIAQDRHADAQPVLAECIEIRQRILPEGHWLIWNTQSLFGETLSMQSNFVEAEGLLVEAAEQMDPSEASKNRRDEAIQRVVDLYTAWHAAEPGNGYDTKAEEWRERLGDSD